MKHFTNGDEVKVADYYLEDESTLGSETSATAIVFQSPTDEELLVGIEYDSGTLDYVPQDVLIVIHNRGK